MDLIIGLLFMALAMVWGVKAHTFPGHTFLQGIFYLNAITCAAAGVLSIHAFIQERGKS